MKTINNNPSKYSKCNKCLSHQRVTDFNEIPEDVDIDLEEKSIKQIFYCEECELYTIEIKDEVKRLYTSSVFIIDPKFEDFLLEWKAMKEEL